MRPSNFDYCVVMLRFQELFTSEASAFRHPLLRVALVGALLAGAPRSTDAFDTYWHWEMATSVGNTYGFSGDAVKTMQMSSSAVDYFGPFMTEIVGGISKSISYLELRDLPTTGETHAASNFMHFDNLAARLDRNWKFDYLWSRLYENTQKTLVRYYRDTSRKIDHRKMLILLSLGASLHMVEDFYSHTDWTHFDFAKRGFAQQRTKEGELYAPTWFEVRKRLGAPSSRKRTENWKFRLCTGIFPSADSVPTSSMNVPLSHTAMNHDNSQLYYSGTSQIKYHGFGAVPATDSASAVAHQRFAINTARMAGIEWISLLERDPAVRTAIEFAKGWDMTKVDKEIANDLKDASYAAILVSCIFQKWDGDNPPKERDKVCGTFKLLAHIHIPTTGNLFWGAFPKDSILQHLNFGIGDSTGHYAFDSLWVVKHPYPRPLSAK